MILSRSYALAAPQPAMDTDARPYLTAAPDIGALLGGQDINPPSELDLRTSGGFVQLRHVSSFWSELSETRRNAWLRDVDLMLPPRRPITRDIALLPGGAVTVREPNSILVCDPAEAVSFNETETKRLRRVLGVRADVTTLSHTVNGVVASQRIPKFLPPQAVTVVPDAARLPVRTGLFGAMIIQWNMRGAVAWPLVEAPASLALAATIAASPLARNRRGTAHHQSAIATETWCAESAEARFQLIAPALAEHAGDVIGDLIDDELRFALMDACVEGSESLAGHIAEALAMLPTCFLRDHDTMSGTPPSTWRHAMGHILDAPNNLALIGLDNMRSAVETIRGLRDVIEDADVIAFAENGDALPCSSVPLHSDAAIFLAQYAREHGTLAVAVQAPAQPVDLYALAHDAAAATGARVIAIAPCWGFCHRVAPDGEETGNASWFGMGTGLDEVDAPLADYKRCA